MGNRLAKKHKREKSWKSQSSYNDEVGDKKLLVARSNKICGEICG